MNDIIRTARHGCFRIRSNAWGRHLAPCSDPEATAELEPGALDCFQLHAGISRIPASLWSRWVQLCFHFAHLKQGDLEVSCRLLRHEQDRSRWRLLIPQQDVNQGEAHRCCSPGVWPQSRQRLLPLMIPGTHQRGPDTPDA